MNNKYGEYMKELDDVYTVSNYSFFIYLDLFLLSFFLGFLLYSQMDYWKIPVLFASSLFLITSCLFHIFLKNKPT